MLKSKEARRLRSFREAYPELSDVNNTQILRMLNKDRHIKSYVDTELISKMSEIEVKQVDCYC